MTAAPKISIASRHEAATSEAIVAALRPGLGTLRLLERAGITSRRSALTSSPHS
jgi:hypothetical protein